MEKQKEETTTIVVTRKLRDFLDYEGVRNETFDQIIKRLVGFDNKQEGVQNDE